MSKNLPDPMKRILTLLTMIALIISIFLRYIDHWIANLFTQFVLQYSFFFLLVLIYALWKRPKSVLSLLSLTGLLFNLILILPLHLPNKTNKPSSGETIEVLSINLWSQNKEVDAVKKLIKEYDADIVLLLEYTPSWNNALGYLKREYTHQSKQVRSDNFGMAILSKLPMEADLKVDDVPSVNASINLGSSSFHLLARHPRPPLSPSNYQEQKEVFSRIEAWVNNTDLPVIVAGDLNSNSFSSHYNELLQNTRLVDSRKGFGLQPTWPASLGPLGITLDHFLVTENWEIEERKVLNKIGSDHTPIYIQLKKPPLKNGG